MTLKTYYGQIEIELAKIDSRFVHIVSKETPNGGREGVVSEVIRETAAKLIVENKARLLTAAEVAKLQAEQQQAQRQKDLAELQERVRMTRLAEEELAAMRRAIQPERKGK